LEELKADISRPIAAAQMPCCRINAQPFRLKIIFLLPTNESSVEEYDGYNQA
jgi:hypothetical protein